MRPLLLTLAFAGCAGDSPNHADALLTTYADELAHAGTVLITLETGVAGAADVAAIGSLQEAYGAQIGAAVDAIDQVATGLGGCETEADLTGPIDEVHASVGVIKDAVALLILEHAAHSEVNHCQAALVSHVDDVKDALDVLDALQPTWAGAALVCDTPR